jgi:hypothetical protein
MSESASGYPNTWKGQKCYLSGLYRGIYKKPFKLIELATAVERALTVRVVERPASNVTPIRQPKRT